VRYGIAQARTPWPPDPASIPRRRLVAGAGIARACCARRPKLRGKSLSPSLSNGGRGVAAAQARHRIGNRWNAPLWSAASLARFWVGEAESLSACRPEQHQTHEAGCTHSPAQGGRPPAGFVAELRPSADRLASLLILSEPGLVVCPCTQGQNWKHWPGKNHSLASVVADCSGRVYRDYPGARSGVGCFRRPNGPSPRPVLAQGPGNPDKKKKARECICSPRNKPPQRHPRALARCPPAPLRRIRDRGYRRWRESPVIPLFDRTTRWCSVASSRQKKVAYVRASGTWRQNADAARRDPP